LGLTIGVIAVAMITSLAVSNIDFIVMGADPSLCNIIPGGLVVVLGDVVGMILMKMVMKLGYVRPALIPVMAVT